MNKLKYNVQPTVKRAYILKNNSGDNTVEMLSMPDETDLQLTPEALNRANSISTVTDSISHKNENVNFVGEKSL